MTKNIAHRGFSAAYPENTMPAFEAAVKAGCDGIELDVRLTGDGQVVVCHDDILERVSDGRGPVREHTLSQLKTLDFSHGHGGFGRVEVPTLREYLDYIRAFEVFTNIEIKSSLQEFLDLEQAAVALVREFGLEQRVVFSSFNHYFMVLCHKLAPEIPCGLLYGQSQPWLEAGQSAHDYARLCGAEYLHPHFRSVDEETVRAAGASGVGVNAWTVNEEADMRRLIAWGAAGVITNHPDVLHRVLREGGPA